MAAIEIVAEILRVIERQTDMNEAVALVMSELEPACLARATILGHCCRIAWRKIATNSRLSVRLFMTGDR